jgi:hypothetical protein
MNDTCPQCLHRDNPPTSKRPSPGGTRATYRCTRCRHRWTTDWAGRSEATDWTDWEPRTAFD